MNIIEDIRDALLHAVENRSQPPRTPMDLWTVLKDEWCELPPGYIQTLIESMPRRVAALLRAGGFCTKSVAPKSTEFEEGQKAQSPFKSNKFFKPEGQIRIDWFSPLEPLQRSAVKTANTGPSLSCSGH
ncbi:hypothetical protein AVEN_15434-1 [Araneus ventricosus]|uniref:Uncharacterized protein n=1 Tax=Araneus ventricosus TaxID=182803 RepID=A0A4Y2CTJ6_ARAVE|nr:hypothetical protein AVEN_15434-1 [Araneus ventricosus]